MKAHEGKHNAVRMTAALRVSRSGYYRSRSGRTSPRAAEDKELRERIVSIHQESRETYGSPRITLELRKESIRLGKNRVARLMREAGISGVGRRRRMVRTTRSDERLPVAPNRLKGLDITDPNQAWAADITYVGTDEGWGYLAAVMDMWSRKIVGWSFKSHMETSLVADALKNALHTRRPGKGLIHHSDRGSQYASSEYRQLLEHHEIEASMSAKGNCYDNATMESFFGTLKSEEIHRRIYRTQAEARREIFHYIESFYNLKRNHTSLEGWSPEEFESKNSFSPAGENRFGSPTAELA